MNTLFFSYFKFNKDDAIISLKNIQICILRNDVNAKVTKKFINIYYNYLKFIIVQIQVSFLLKIYLCIL